MQMFENLPWYGYIIFIVAIGSFVLRYFLKAKEGYAEPDLARPKFRKDPSSQISEDQFFALSLDAVTTENWKANTNTLQFVTGIRAKNYIQGWGIDTKEGYWDFANRLMEFGRRGYFDFIYDMMQHQPEAEWNNILKETFGENERVERYFTLLKNGTAQGILKAKGIITFDSELEIGVVGYDASLIIGHARRAYTANLISEEEAWKVIGFASNMARQTFSSWEDFAKSYIIGFTLDIRDRKDGFHEEMYHMYGQLLKDPNSPWKTLTW